MAKLIVEVIRPRRVVIGTDAAGRPIYRTFTAEDCRRYAERGNRMIASSVAIPVCWGHRDDAKPRNADDARSRFAKSTAGWIEQYRLEKDGRVLAVADLPDDEAAQAEKVKFASPEIERFIDGNGRNWGEVVTHLALTPRPRQHEQTPITRLGLESQGTQKAGRIRLAIDPVEGRDMADESEDTGTDTGADTESEGGGSDYFQDAIEHLKNKGIILPDDTTPENAWERIVIACMQGETPEEEGEESEEATGDGSTITEGVAPGMNGTVSLAFEKQQKLARAMALKTLNTEISHLFNVGRITRPIRERMTARLGSIQLSFDEAGELKRNDLIIEIEAYKRLPKFSAWSKSTGTKLSHTSRVEEVADNPLDDGGDDPSDKQVERFLEDWDAAAGRKKK